MSDRVVRYLVLSDLHFAGARGQRPSTPSPPILEEIARLAYVYAQSGEIKAILVLGDLGDTGDALDLKAAAAYFKTVPGPAPTPWINGAQPTLAASELPIYAMPGNHDRYMQLAGPQNLWNPKAGNPAFDAIFSPPELSNAPWTPRAVETWHLPGGSDRSSIAVVAADFSLEHEWDFTVQWGEFGQGRVYDVNHAELVAQTQAAQQQGALVLWAIHFVPDHLSISRLASAPHSHRCTLIELPSPDTILETAVQLNVSHILSGHTHRVVNAPFPAAPTVHLLGAGSACCRAKSDDTSIHVLRIDLSQPAGRQVQQQDLFWTGTGFQ